MALKSSVEQLKGSVQRAVKEIRARLLHQIAYIETALDDPEHFDLTDYPQELQKIVEKESENISELLKTADDGRMIQEGIKTVILGKPNAGKSSLLNFLVGEDRAIVTEIAGTTRDILEEYISLNGITLRVIDTAGIRETEDVVEKIGVGKAKQMAENADLILYVVDSSLPLDDNDREIMELLSGRKSIVIYNKTDLEAAVDIEELKEKQEARSFRYLLWKKPESVSWRMRSRGCFSMESFPLTMRYILQMPVIRPHLKNQRKA